MVMSNWSCSASEAVLSIPSCSLTYHDDRRGPCRRWLASDEAFESCGVLADAIASKPAPTDFVFFPSALVGLGIRHQSPGFSGQGLEELTLQLGIVAGQFDQALFQFAGFVFQPQL